MLDTYRELVDLLASAPTSYRDAVAAAGEPPTGEWNAAQVMAHMAATEQFWLDRLNLILHQRDPLLRPPSAEINTLQEQMMQAGAQDNLDAFNRLRGETISLMMGLSLQDWSRSGTHATRGEITIEDVVEGMVDHDSEHLAQIVALGSGSR